MAEDASKLCLDCGLCCSGDMFEMVPLAEVEVARMTRLGLPVMSKHDRPGMLMPCAALDGTACTIYQERPMRCFWYRCKLLEKLHADRVSLERALGVVKLAKELEGAQREQFIRYHLTGS
jgi:hypothetical protein